MRSFKIVIWPVLLVIILSLVALGGCAQGGEVATGIETEGRMPENVTPVAAAALIESNRGNTDFVILDVRTPGGYAEGHIPESVNLDSQSANFGDELEKLDKSRSYLVYCRSGVRSAAAVKVMTEHGFKTLYNMTGGINEWRSAGFATVK